jgi:hypothetical protein
MSIRISIDDETAIVTLQALRGVHAFLGENSRKRILVLCSRIADKLSDAGVDFERECPICGRTDEHIHVIE